ncbi:MAG: cation:dicarboxylase symporter family transporter, partial [Candidatus Latescibacteria bacterium]|nr:cation:dicarboxylase symporter family transporter [Candidatus Latescibacterota bacterium]
MGKFALHWQILIALVLAVLVGMAFDETVLQFAFVGTLFLQALKMIIVPLIATSIISGVAGIGGGQFGRLGGQTFAYYMMTSLLAIITGLFLVNILTPGRGAELGLKAPPEKLANSMAQFGDGPWDAIQRLLLDMVPTNVVQAAAQGQILPLIVFCLLLGLAITRLPDPHQGRLRDFFQSAFEAMMKMTNFIIRLAPIGIFALVAKIVGTTGLDIFVDLGLYALTVFLGLSIHAAITLPILLFLVGGLSPLAHFRAMAPALLTAFSTSSSSATLPLTMDSLEQRAGVSNRTTSFVVPLGATINDAVAEFYAAKAASGDVRVSARGFSSSQLKTRLKFIAAAVAT